MLNPADRASGVPSAASPHSLSLELLLQRDLPLRAPVTTVADSLGLGYSVLLYMGLELSLL